MLARKVELGSGGSVVPDHFNAVLWMRRPEVCELTAHVQDSVVLQLHFERHLADIWDDVKIEDLLKLVVLKSCEIGWGLAAFRFTHVRPVDSSTFIVPFVVMDFLLLFLFSLRFKTEFGSFRLLLLFLRVWNHLRTVCLIHMASSSLRCLTYGQ